MKMDQVRCSNTGTEAAWIEHTNSNYGSNFLVFTKHQIKWGFVWRVSGKLPKYTWQSSEQWLTAWYAVNRNETCLVYFFMTRCCASDTSLETRPNNSIRFVPIECWPRPRVGVLILFTTTTNKQQDRFVTAAKSWLDCLPVEHVLQNAKSFTKL